MQSKQLKQSCISNLILIILNDKYDDITRKFAEIELRSRVRNFGVYYEDLLHLDSEVIKERGLDIDNYLISANVNMQQLMEIYFKYVKGNDNDLKNLLISEGHLCNELDLGSPFFANVCDKEIENIDKRLANRESQRQVLESAKQILLQRKETYKKVIKNGHSLDSFLPETILRMSKFSMCWWYPLHNLSYEEKYKFYNSFLGGIKLNTANFLSYMLDDLDIIQHLYVLRFARQDSSKLSKQKNQILLQVERGFEVDYESDKIKRYLNK